MKIKIYLFVSLFLINFHTYPQCGASTACNTNTGIFSNNTAADIAYDNMGSAFHSTFIKETNGVWKVWGENLGNDGILDVLNTQVFDATNYPTLTGSIYKMAIGSDSIDDVQLIVLTSTGLFIVGDEGAVVSNNLTNSNAFQKLTIDGQTNGLPSGLLPEDIKMMFASTGTLILTTCSGNVYVLSTDVNMRGNNLITAEQWYKVQENSNTQLTNVIVARGNGSSAFALKADGTIWTWGFNTFLGNGTALSTRNFATQMILPAGLTGVKMIQTTLNDLIPSYYLLGTDKKVYALGNNSYGHLGDNSITTRTSWVNAKNPNGSTINDAAWISSNEHDLNYPGLAIIKTSGLIYTAGYNSNYMIGRLLTSNPNFLGLPNGLVASDVITFAEVGGHTCALIKQCNDRYGYVGHKINGSMGNGISVSATTQIYDFITPPVINVCGTANAVPVISVIGPAICAGQNAVFNVNGFAGQTITYSINNGSGQNIILDANGLGAVTIYNPSTAVTMTIYQIGSSATCVFPVNIAATINQSPAIIPNFTQVQSICKGSNLSALPTTSMNGIIGTWSPALNNNQTTTYNFLPNSGQCAAPASTQIVVFPIVTPTFNPVAAINSGQTLLPLPTTSLNGIQGTWSPALNNTLTTTYTFTPITGQCAIPTQLTINVNSILNVTPAFNTVAAICIGDILAALPTISLNNINGTWSPALNNQLTTIYTFVPNLSQNANTTTLTITVIAKIIPTFNVVNPICEGDFIATLPITSNNGITGAWSPALNNILTTNYLFTPNAGLCATTTNLLISVNPKISPTFNAVPDICSGDILLPLPTTSLNGITGSWSPVLNNMQTTVYTFIPTPGVCATNQILKIIVKSIQTPIFNPISNICEGDFLLPLPTTSLNGIAGTWSPALNNLLTTKYFFTPNSGICDNIVDLTINVTIKKTPIFSAIPDLCFGDVPPGLPAVSNNGINGFWTPNIVSNIKSDVYSFIPNPNQCTNLPSPLNITVYRDIDFRIQSECVNENYVYKLVVSNKSFDLNTANINWKDDYGISIGNNQEFDITNYLKNNNIIPKFPINIAVSVTLTNGCDKEKSIVINNIYCGIQKGISPNNDNKNDFFDLQLLDVKNLKIYNRYGTVVYFLGSYSKQWTGQDYNNRQLPDGTYFYEIEFNNNSEIKVGWIYLSKEIKD